MNFKSFSVFALVFVGLMTPMTVTASHSMRIEAQNSQNETQSIDTLIHALASLNYHVDTLKNSSEDQEIDSIISFEDEDVKALWDKGRGALEEHLKEWKLDYELARSAYYQAKELTEPDYQETKNYLLSHSSSYLYSLWIRALELESNENCSGLSIDSHICILRSVNASFENNSSISQKIKKAMRPYVIPDNHPMKPILDSIFQASRVTQDETSFLQAGFKTIGKVRPRTFLRVASHPKLPNYLLKIYLDDERRKKRGDPSWKWLVRRCIGAEKIRKIIRSKNIKRFTVANKWIYPLPEHPAPPNNWKYTRHLALLLVTNMNLVPYKQNVRAWYYDINENDLNELYYIISRAKGSSYRPDNIWLTTNNQFAFIDTEYPNGGPDFSRIRKYLRSSMLNYWDKLVRNGG